MRPWDNFFWCVELDGFPAETQVLPAEWPPNRGVRPGQTTIRVLENNRISVRTAAQQATVWLTPGIVDFERQVKVTVIREVRAVDFAR